MEHLEYHHISKAFRHKAQWHESPFVCADHNQPARRFITEFLDQERYGAVFEKFIERTVAHFAVTTDSGNATAWRTRETEDTNAVAAMN